jgi:hypothetical protein
MKKTQRDELKAVVTLECSEHGCGSIYIHATNAQEAANGHLLLAEVQPELRALASACRRAAEKLLPVQVV